MPRKTTKSQESEPVELTPAQQMAIALILNGNSNVKTAELLEVSADSVGRWRNEDTAFQAELNRRLVDLHTTHDTELLSLQADARRVLKSLLDSPSEKMRLTAALSILDRKPMQPDKLPTTPKAIEKAKAREALFDFEF